MTEPMTEPRIDVHLGPEDLLVTMRADVRQGLTSTPKWLPPKYFYDARGSELFEEITRLPEYYPTRTERSILGRSAPEIAALARPGTLVELGSGSSEKTRLLLDALQATGQLRRYVPVDVSESALQGALSALSREYPRLELHGVVADFEHQLDRLPSGDRRMVAFLGSTIGNMGPVARERFLGRLHEGLVAGDTLLLGTDLVKGPERLVPAYDDAAGVTAEFNRNVLHVLNQQLGANFDPDAFDHVARWNASEEQMEMWLRARHRVDVVVTELDLAISFAEGEAMRTETSAKFRIPGLRDELARAGFRLLDTWTDERHEFAVGLFQR